MDETTLLLVDSSITEYAKHRCNFLGDVISCGSKTTEIYLKNQSDFQENFIKHANCFVKDFQQIHGQSILKNKETSCNFNILEIFEIGETKHSYLLAHFLNPNAAHGQKHLFLNVFLDLLQIEHLHDNENWIVTAEKGRIDVLLKRIQPHSVIIIENKSNYASDQNHQLYRYWYQEIYQTIRKRHLPEDYIFNPPERFYQLLYLSPAHWKIPSTNTLTKPIEWDNDLPKKVPLNVKHLFFNDFICKWLNKSLELLPKGNHRIREYVKQYIEYWS